MITCMDNILSSDKICQLGYCGHGVDRLETSS